MKKKYVVTMLVVIISALVALIVIGIFHSSSNDAKKFKKEYESLNGQKNANGKEYISVDIKDDSKIYYATYQEIMDLLNHGTGVIYFGFPECPWCRNMIPVLLDAADETSIEKIYYFNALSMRDTKSLKDGVIVTEKEGTEEYYQLLNALSSILGPYEGLNDDTILRLYFPTVVFVKNGTIVGSHEGTLDSQEDPYVALTTEQKEELKKIYTDFIHEVLGDICDSKC